MINSALEIINLKITAKNIDNNTNLLNIHLFTFTLHNLHL